MEEKKRRQEEKFLQKVQIKRNLERLELKLQKKRILHTVRNSYERTKDSKKKTRKKAHLKNLKKYFNGLISLYEKGIKLTKEEKNFLAYCSKQQGSIKKRARKIKKANFRNKKLKQISKRLNRNVSAPNIILTKQRRVLQRAKSQPNEKVLGKIAERSDEVSENIKDSSEVIQKLLEDQGERDLAQLYEDSKHASSQKKGKKKG